jgi:hypothetical protein
MTHPSVQVESPERSMVSAVVRGAIVRAVLSVLIPVVWISLTLVYLAFFAPSFTLVQDVVLVVVSLFALIGALTVMWVSFGVRTVHRWIDW